MANYAVTGSALLYGSVVPLSAERHAGLAMRVDAARFGFAARTALVPLVAEEFPLAMADYPIVFVGALRQPMAVVGVSPEANAFVGADGAYRAGAYLPAYLLRMPFALADSDHGPVLCLDEASPLVGAAGQVGSQALFDGAAPSALLREATDFCHEYAAAEDDTRELVRVLGDLQLFVGAEASFTPLLADGGWGAPELLLTYAMVSRERLAALGDEIRAMFEESKAMPILEAHLQSLANWERLSAGA